MAEYETLQVEQRGEAEWLTLNRPEALNTVNKQMLAELHDYLDSLPGRDEIRIVVLGALQCSLHQDRL